MKTGKHYFGLLTEEEQRNFKQEVDEQVVPFEYMMNANCSSLDALISCAFLWSETKQGRLYWETIANSNRDENRN